MGMGWEWDQFLEKQKGRDGFGKWSMIWDGTGAKILFHVGLYFLLYPQSGSLPRKFDRWRRNMFRTSCL